MLWRMFKRFDVSVSIRFVRTIFLCLASLAIFVHILLMCINANSLTFPVHPSRATVPGNEGDADIYARTDLTSWMRHLRHVHPQGKIVAERLGCREFTMGAQTCVYEGLLCINTTSSANHLRGSVYFVDDEKMNNKEVPSDKWCSYRHTAAEPWYFGARHWPIWKGTIAPQQSCMNARYRTSSSVFGSRRDIEPSLLRRIKWIPDLWLIDMDFPGTDHNNDFAIDLYWLLDAQLFATALDLKQSPARPTSEHFEERLLFAGGPKHIMTPQTKSEFLRQTRRDINRLLWVFFLQLDAKRLYGEIDLARPPKKGESRWTKQLLDAYPELLRLERLILHKELVKDEHIDMVCSARLTAGPKRYDGAHEHVCRHLRDVGYRLFGVYYPKLVVLGRIRYPQPPKRIVILQRHQNRGILRLPEVVRALHDEFDRHNVEIEVVSTKHLRTAEEFVRVFSRAGVLISSHGSQNMGQIWMPRHAALIEVMPVGFTDYAFRLLSRSCEVWYYEMQSLRDPKYTREYYLKRCPKNEPFLLNKCHSVKGKSVLIDIEQLIYFTHDALMRLGHNLGNWMDVVPEWNKKYEYTGRPHQVSQSTADENSRASPKK